MLIPITNGNWLVAIISALKPKNKVLVKPEVPLDYYCRDESHKYFSELNTIEVTPCYKVA